MAGGNTYSTAIAWTKVVLPLIAIGLLSTLFLFSRTPDPDAALPYVDADQLVREQRLSRPRFAGTLEDGREVALVADTAAAAAGDPNTILMTTIDGTVILSEEETANVTADAGDMNLASQIIELVGSVVAVTTAGYRLSTEQLFVTMGTLGLQSPGTIRLTGAGIDLEAGAMDMSGPQGETFVSFTGGVRLLYQPEN
jgi:lipopolysaccharide export system protein LptC